MVAPFRSQSFRAGIPALPNVSVDGDSIEDPWNYSQGWDSVVAALGGVKLNGQILGNGSFEADATGAAPSQWTVTSGTLVVDTAQAKYGVKSGKFTASAASCFASFGGDAGAVRTGLQPGRQFTYSVWVFFPVIAHGTLGITITDNDGSGAATTTGVTVAPAAGWQRISASRTLRGTVGTPGSLTEAYLRVQWTGATIGDICYIDGAQLDTGLWSGAQLPPYVGDLRASIAGTQLQQVFSAQTVTASGNEQTDATRTTGTQGDGRAAPDSSFGLWEATTNLVRNGGFETNITDWVAASGATLTRDTTQHKFGAASLKVVTSNIGANEGANNNFGTPIAASTTYTESFWANVPAGVVMAAVVNLYNGVTFVSQVSGGTFTGTGAWQRVTFTFTTPAGVTLAYPYVYTNVRGAVTFYLDGFQIEATGRATPYVETAGATATRAIARVQVGMGGMTQVQGWVAACVRPQWAGTALPNAAPIVFEWLVSDFSQVVNLYRSSTTQWAVSSTVGGSAVVCPVTAAHNAGDLVTLVAYWTPTQIGLSVNGGAFVTATRTGAVQTATMPTNADLGSRSGTGLSFDGEVEWFAMGAGTLAAQDAINLAALGATDPSLALLVNSNPQTALAALGLGFAFPALRWPAATTAADQAYANSGLATVAQSLANVSPRADILIVQKGINDFFAGTALGAAYAVTPTTWRAAVRAFLMLVNALNPRPYVVWIGLVTTVAGPNAGFGGGGVDWATGIDDMKRQMNAIARQECADAGVPFALLHPDMPVSLVGADNVHPSVPAGQQRVADRILQLLGVG